MSRPLSEKQKAYLYSHKNIEKMVQNRKNQKESPSKGKHLWAVKEHPRGFKNHKRTPSELESMSLRMSGEKNPMYGVRQEKNVERMTKNNPMFRPEISKKVALINKLAMQVKYEDYSEREKFVRRIRAGLIKPTQPERVVMGIISKNNFSFIYAGKGGIWFKGEGKIFNPDFVDKQNKLIIEVYGDYWHNLPERVLIDKERISAYEKYGYKTLIIWEKEVIFNRKPITETSEIVQKINNFVGGKK